MRAPAAGGTENSTEPPAEMPAPDTEKAGLPADRILPDFHVLGAEDGEGIGEGGLHPVGDIGDARGDGTDLDMFCHGRVPYSESFISVATASTVQGSGTS